MKPSEETACKNKTRNNRVVRKPLNDAIRSIQLLHTRCGGISQPLCKNRGKLFVCQKITHKVNWRYKLRKPNIQPRKSVEAKEPITYAKHGQRLPVLLEAGVKAC